MEETRVSLFNSVPSFAQGTDILLVHNDTLSLGYLSSLLRQCSFRVTATNQASAAIDMVCQQEGRFKLVMAKANMPDMNTLSFVRSLLLKRITVIFVSSGKNDGVAKAAFDKGSCYLLQEPIQPEDLIYVWQQVYSPNNNLPQEIHTAKSKVHESSENQNRSHHDVKGKKKGKRTLNSHQMNLGNNIQAAEKQGEETRELNNDRFPQKKPRISWTSDLHHKFVQAISVLGENNIRPKLIQEMMNVPYLTCRHIASHLQKFKSQVKRLQDICNIYFPPGSKSSNFSDGTQSSSSFQSQSYPGHPTLPAFQNENQNQNQFPMNFAEPKGQENFQQQENPGCVNFSFQHPTELVHYENQDLEAVVRGAMPNALMDKKQYECFENGSTGDSSAQNSEIQKNSTFGNGSSSQNFYSSKVSCAKPSTAVGEPEPDASMNQRKIPTEDNSEILKSYIHGKGPDDITQNSEILKSYIHGSSTSSHQSDSCNPSSVSLLKAKPFTIVGGPDLTDQNISQREHDTILRFLGEGYDCFGKGPRAQNSEMVRNSILGNNFGLQQSDNYNPSYVKLSKSKPETLKNQDQTPTEYNNISRFLGEDRDSSKNSRMLRNSVSGNSSSSLPCADSIRFLKAKPCAVEGGTVPDALMDRDKALAEHNNTLGILGDDSDGYGCLGNETSLDDIAMLRNAIFGDCRSP